MDMSGHEWSPTGPDWGLISRVLSALSKADRATRTRSGLTKRAEISRTTVNKVLAGQWIRDDKLEALDDAVLVPPGTLKAAGMRDANRLNALGVDGPLRHIIDTEITPVTPTPRSPKTRNRRVV